MNMRYLYLVLAVSACATTPEYKTKRSAESVFTSCLDEYNDEALCKAKSSTYCRDHGLYTGCGTEMLWGKWPRWRNPMDKQ